MERSTPDDVVLERSQNRVSRKDRRKVVKPDKLGRRLVVEAESDRRDSR